MLAVLPTAFICAQIPSFPPDTTHIPEVDPPVPLDTLSQQLTDSLLELTLQPDGRTVPSLASSSDLSVGSPAGSFSVSPMGAALYNVAIEVPKGLGGMVPALSIAYNSQGGMGLAGYGFNLSGLSVITRGRRDLAHDGYVNGLTYTETDALFLDGKRLLLTSGSEGMSGCVYSPEGNPFTKVTLRGTGSTQWFEVKTPDGIVCQYGHNTASRQSFTSGGYTKVHAWYVNRTEDALGNYMTFSYGRNNLFVYPTAITYGGNTHTETGLANTVQFSYTSLGPAAQPFRLQSAAGKMDKLLTAIETKTGNNVFRRYELSYDTTSDGSTTKFPRLTSITEKNGSGESLPPVSFSWDFLPEHEKTVSIHELPNRYWIADAVEDREFYAADISNDGLCDIVEKAWVNGDVEYTLYLNRRDSTGAVAWSPGIIFFPNNPDFPRGTPELNPLFTDFDGDGINDVFAPIRSDGYYGLSLFYGHDLLRSDLGCHAHYSFSAQHIPESDVPLTAFQDIDADGRGDMLVLVQGQEIYGYPLYFIQGRPRGASTEDNDSTFITLPNTPRKIFLSDYNGDGLADLMALYEGGYSLYWNSPSPNGGMPFSDNLKVEGTNIGWAWKTEEGDFNGDGLPDLILNESRSGDFYFALNKGNGSFEKVLAYTSEINDQSTEEDNNKFTVLVSDMDHDGKSDVLIAKAMYHPFGPYMYTGIRWLCSTGTALELKRAVTTQRSEDAGSCNFMLGDFSGNGETELLHYGNDLYSQTANTSDDIRMRLYKTEGYSPASGRISQISDGYGKTDYISYQTLSHGEIYEKGNLRNFPVCEITLNLPVVSSVYRGNGAAGGHRQSFRYGGLRIHRQGRGVLGFSTHGVTDSADGTDVLSSVGEWHSTYCIPQSDTTTTTLTDGSETATVTTYTITPKGFADKNYLCLPTSVETNDFDGYLTTTTRQYNTANGYITEERTEYDNASIYRATTYSQYALHGGVWKPGKITRSSSNSASSPAFSTEQTFTYDSHGLPLTVTHNSHSALALTTTYTYDEVGNVLTSTQTGLGVNPVTSYNEYDATHRFVTRSYTSPASAENLFTYDVWGNTLTETDVTDASSPITVIHTYDGWGRLTKTVSPTGAETRYHTGWGDSGSQRYFTVTDPDGGQWVKTWYDKCGREVATESRLGSQGVLMAASCCSKKCRAESYS